MFKYDKKIDSWSWKMIKGIKSIWGNDIPKGKIGINNLSVSFINKFLNEYTKLNGQEIIAKLNKITNLNFKLKDFSFYINTTLVSLHNAKDMFVSVSLTHSLLNYPTVIIHELSHIYFYKYVEGKEFLESNNINDISDLLSISEKNEIKELLTVIINSEFKKLIYTEDKGYPNHKKLREMISKKWNQNKNFNELIKFCIKEYKKEMR